MLHFQASMYPVDQYPK